MLVTVNVWSADCPAVCPGVVAPADDPVVPLDDPFSSTPVTRTRWFTYWLKLTLEPWGLSR
jgi:hypothetical protein